MKTIKIVIISLITIGFMVWLWTNQPNPLTEQATKETGATDSQVFDSQHSDSALGSVAQNRTATDAAQSPNPSSFYILFTSNHLSLEASSHPLQAIVDKIVQQSGITIIVSEAIANSPITIQFHDLSIEQGLQRLFENYDIFFFYSRDNDKSTRLANVWVYPQGQGKKLAPISSSIAAHTNEPIEVHESEMTKDTMDSDPVKRASAIANLVDEQGNAAAEIVQNALTDPDENIRIHALDAALRARLDLPLDTLMDLAQNDASATIRSIALAGLFNRSEGDSIKSSDILEILLTAQKDDAPEVSELATQYMKSLEEASEPNERKPQEIQEQSMDP